MENLPILPIPTDFSSLFSPGFEEHLLDHPGRKVDILVEDLPELTGVHKTTRVRRDFFMPAGLESVDSALNPDYHDEYAQVIQKYQGNLHNHKEVHHIQLAPLAATSWGKKLDAHYFPGPIYSFQYVEDCIKAGESLPLSSQYVVHEIHTGELADRVLANASGAMPNYFARLKAQTLSNEFTWREIIHIYRRSMQNSNSRAEKLKRIEMALLSGRQPESMKNVVRKLTDLGGCIRAALNWYAGKKKNGREARYSHAEYRPARVFGESAAERRIPAAFGQSRRVYKLNRQIKSSFV